MADPDSLTVKFDGAEKKISVTGSTTSKQVISEAAQLFHFRQQRIRLQFDLETRGRKRYLSGVDPLM